MQDNEPINLTYGQMSDMVNRIEQIPPLSGTGAPTTSTPAFHLGQTYLDTTNDQLYFCSSIPGENDPLEYTWEPIDTNTTYSDFVGTDGTATGTHGLVPAPATTDADKFLKADGTWEEVGGGVTELTSADYNWNITAGDATTEPFDCVALWLLEPGQYYWKNGVSFKLMKTWNPNQNSGQAVVWDAGVNSSDVAMTGIFATYAQNSGQIRLVNTSTGEQIWGNSYLLATNVYGGGNFRKISIGSGAYYGPEDAIAIGTDAYIPYSNDTDAIAIGHGAQTRKNSVALGKGASTAATDAIAIGTSANASSTLATDAIVIGNSATTSAPGTIVIGKSSQSNTGYGIAIGNNVKGGGIAIGRNISSGSGVTIGDAAATSGGTETVAIGTSATASATRGIAIGQSAEVATDASFSVALGSYSKVAQKGEVGIGLTPNSTYGYNNSAYRLLTGLYDPQSAHDAATKDYVDTAISALQAEIGDIEARLHAINFGESS